MRVALCCDAKLNDKCKKCCVTKSKCRSDLTDTHTEKNSLRNSLSFFISFLPTLYWQNLLLLYIVAHFTYRTLCLHTNKSTCKERKMQKWIHTHKRWEIPQQNQIWTFFVTSISNLRKKHEIHIVADVKGKEKLNWNGKWHFSLSRDGTIANQKIRENKLQHKETRRKRRKESTQELFTSNCTILSRKHWTKTLHSIFLYAMENII